MARLNPERTIAFNRNWGVYPGGSLKEVWVSNRQYSGSKTPNFETYATQHRKLPPLAYVVDYWTATNSTATAWAKYPQSNPETVLAGYYQDRTTSAYIDTFSTDAETKAKALGRLADNVKNLKVNLAQAFAERKQTVGLVASSATRIAQAALALRRGRLGDAANALKVRYDPKLAREVTNSRRLGRNTLADYWLELQYGWKPLLQDVYGATELLADHIRNDFYHHRAIGKAETRDERKTFWINDGFYPFQDYPTGVATCIDRGKYTIFYRMDSASRQALASTGLSNPALLAWELLPYSFVVDWFLPVGNYLEQLDAFSGFELAYGIYSHHKRSWGYYDLHQDILGPQGAGTYVRRQLSASSSSGRLTREVLSSFPSAVLPSFKNPISVTHALNALALLTSAFSSNGRRVR